MSIDRLKSSNFLNSNKNIDFHITTGATELHSHKDYYEFICITAGRLKYNINGVSHILSEGDFSFIRPSDYHGFFIVANNKYPQHVNIAVKTDYFTTLCNNLNPFLFQNMEKLDTPPIIHLNDQEYNQTEFWKRMINTTISHSIDEGCSYATTLLTILLSFLIKKFNFNSMEMPKWFVELLDKISASVFSPVSMMKLYENTCYSPPVIIETFRKYFNQTPIQYLNNLKINYAKNMLKNTDYPILYISNKIGFSSLSHFNHIFKEITGTTPSEYRKQN